jgi:hypothetical protein
MARSASADESQNTARSDAGERIGYERAIVTAGLANDVDALNQ